MATSGPPAAPPSGQSEGRLVAKNTAYLAAAQVLTIPIAVVLNVLYARVLGPADLGLIYLAITMCGLGAVAFEWGQAGVLPALIAQNRSRAAALLGTCFAWRGAAACIAYLFLAGLSLLTHEGALFQWVLALTFLAAFLNSLAGGYKDAIRGFERTDIPAIAHVGQQVLLFLAMVVVIWLGGRLNALLCVAFLVPLVTIFGLSRASKPVGIGKLQVRRADFWVLFTMGTPFVINDIAMTLQPFIDGIFLSKLAPAEALGWYAVARRLIGILILPATALIGSLYPTLCRQWEDDKEGYGRTLVTSFSGVALMAIPAAIGCALYPEIGITVFGREEFGPAEDNLRVMSVFLFLVYFSMPLSCAVLAAGKRRAWSIIQSLCIVVSVGLDPLLVPWFQERMGNGGLGLGVASVISESCIVIGGFLLLPRGILGRGLWRTLGLATLSGAAMVGVALALRGQVTPFVAAPVAGFAYIAAALATGAVTASQRETVLGMLRRRLRRAA